MIFKITWEDGRMDICTAKDKLDLIKSYDKDYDLFLQEIESIDEITESELKILIDEIPFITDEFKIIASTEFE